MKDYYVKIGKMYIGNIETSRYNIATSFIEHLGLYSDYRDICSPLIVNESEKDKIDLMLSELFEAPVYTLFNFELVNNSNEEILKGE